jgi:hypothetical protein
MSSLLPVRRSWSWWRRILLRGLFGTWVAGFLVVGAYQLAPHLLTLPVSQAGDAVVQRFTAARLPVQQGRWLILHVLDEDCPCSLRVLDHLLASQRPVDVAERIVLIARPGAHHYDLDVVTAEQLGDRYHLDAAPLLVVVDPANAVRYLGGYTPRKQAADVRDAAIVAAVMRGERVAPLPTFGCAVGAALRTTVDPLGIRRWN